MYLNTFFTMTFCEFVLISWCSFAVRFSAELSVLVPSDS